MFNRDIVTYILYFIIVLLWFFINKTIWGMSLISVGENPSAADTVGIRVFRIQYLAALFNGIMGGLGGAYLVLGQLGVFSENVTSGRGYSSGSRCFWETESGFSTSGCFIFWRSSGSSIPTSGAWHKFTFSIFQWTSLCPHGVCTAFKQKEQ